MKNSVNEAGKAGPTEKRVKLLFLPASKTVRRIDRCLRPLMYWLQGNYTERPQETHRWNYVALDPKEHLRFISTLPLYRVKGDPAATKRYWGKFVPRHHMPRFGGWRKFVVLRPRTTDWDWGHPWYIGWVVEGRYYVSTIPLSGPVRMLIGPDDAEFFALSKHHRPIPLMTLGWGEIGAAGNFGKYPLR